MSFELWVQSQQDVIESVSVCKRVVEERQWTPHGTLVVCANGWVRGRLVYEEVDHLSSRREQSFGASIAIESEFVETLCEPDLL